MKKTVLVFATLFITGALAACHAQVRVTKSTGGKYGVDLSGVRGTESGPGTAFRRTLETDLQRSGWFSIAPAGAGSFVVQGPFGVPASFGCVVQNAASHETVMNKTFGGSGDPRRLAHEVSDAIVLAITGHRGIASSRVALVGNATGSSELYVCDADGQGLQQLTRDRSISLFPSWAPDNAHLVYVSFKGRYPDTYLINLANMQREVLVSYPGLNSGGAISPNGRELAITLSKDGNPDLYIISPVARGGSLTRLTSTQFAAETSASWSPDGSQIVFVSDMSGRPQMYIMGRAGGDRKRVTSAGSENVAPDWGPGGLIAYSSRREGRYQLCLLDPATLQSTPVSQDAADYEDASWAPDGRHIAVTRTEAHVSAVYVLDIMGDAPIPLLSLQGNWRSPAWSR